MLCIKLLREGDEGAAQQQQLWADWSYSAAFVVGELHPLLSALFCRATGPSARCVASRSEHQH